jgi:hypothetical protein
VALGRTSKYGTTDEELLGEGDFKSNTASKPSMGLGAEDIRIDERVEEEEQAARGSH